MSAAPPPGQRVVAREETIEYRDQDGNLLDEAAVAALEGKVEFRTEYEVRTQLVDEQGRKVAGSGEAEGVAPPHPDIDGADPETKAPHGSEIVDNEQVSSKGAGAGDEGAAKPASEGLEAT